MQSKKIWGAVLAGLSVILYYGILAFIIFLTGLQTREDFIVFVIILGFLAIPIFGVVFALISRVREIKGGEEEEAKKY